MAKKTRIVELTRFGAESTYCRLRIGNACTLFCWKQFKRVNAVICKHLKVNQTRKLKRTQLKNGFKLEIIKPGA